MSRTDAVVVPLPCAEAVERTRAALPEQGFGILTEIDVRATFEKKLAAEAAENVGEHVILGACNPGLASQALAAEPQLGALLPCNVVVRRGTDAGSSTVEAIDPQAMVQPSGSPAVQEVADDAGVRMRAALDVLGGLRAP